MKVLGREEELAALLALVAEGHRLITLLGVAGLGKTTLAELAAEQWREADTFPGGVLFCDLTRAEDEAGLLAVVAEALGLSLEGARALAARRSIVLAGLRDGRRRCLILDNFEQLTPICRGRLEEWLAGAPGAPTLKSFPRDRVAGRSDRWPASRKDPRA